MKKQIIDGRRSKKLTPKQLRFVYEFATKTLLGLQSATESARKSGYSEAVSKKMRPNLWNDKHINIDWPINNPILSRRDK